MAETELHALFQRAETGDARAASELFTTLYAELHRLARVQLARSSGELTIGTTSLLHEAWLGFAGRDGASFPDRARFMAYAAKAMRGLIIDYARQRKAQKRGGRFEITSIENDVLDRATDERELERIGVALDELAGVDPELVRIVDLKFFCGFSFTEIAALSGQSERTVQRHWEKARIWLHRALAP